jgi:hypothetical protein
MLPGGTPLSVFTAVAAGATHAARPGRSQSWRTCNAALGLAVGAPGTDDGGGAMPGGNAEPPAHAVDSSSGAAADLAIEWRLGKRCWGALALTW